MTGRVHSFQSMGAVDGPGVRFVVFLQGCPLRCAYCHNPDTWDPQGGSAYTPEAVCEKIVRYRPYLKHGGVTVSGGEPLLQETDLVLCDLKFADARAYRAHCGASFEQVLQFLSLTEAMAVPLWVRHVVAPGLTDDFDQVREIARIARRFSNLEKLELLPFRKLCAEKYERMGIPFPLKDTPEMEEEALEHLLDLLKAEGLLPKF